MLTLENLQEVTDEVNQDISNLDDTFRPIEELLLLGASTVSTSRCAARCARCSTRWTASTPSTEQIHNAVTDFQAVDAPDAADGRPTQGRRRDETQALQAVIVNTYGPAHLQATQTDQTFDDRSTSATTSTVSRSDDYFYLPREGFDNEDVKTGMQLMMSPDGKAARFVITHEGNAMGPGRHARTSTSSPTR